MANNIQVRDAVGSAKLMATIDQNGVHTPVHRVDTLYLSGASGLSAVNTDLLTNTVNGWYDVGAFASAAIQVVASAGITAGAVIFEQTNDPSSTTGVALEADELGIVNANPVVAAVTIAANTRRMWLVPITARYIRVRISTAFTGGTVQAFAQFMTQPYASATLNVQQATAANLNVNATAQNSLFYNESTSAQAANATLTGTSRDTGAAAGSVHRYSAFNAMVLANQAGTIRLECSNDNSTWRRTSPDTPVAADTPIILSVPIMTRYYRAVFVNGATANTIFMLNTSFTAS